MILIGVRLLFHSLSNAVTRRQWWTAAGSLAAGSFFSGRASAQGKFLPLRTSGLDHVSITVPDSKKAAEFYAPIFDPQIFHERTGVQRYYVRLGAAYIAFGPMASVDPYIDHICAGVVDFKEDLNEPQIKADLAAVGLAPVRGGLPMIADPDQIRLQLASGTHGLFDTIMPGGRVVPGPAALIPIGLHHIMLSVSNIEQSSAHYRKMFGAESREGGRTWFKVADTKLGLELTPAGQKPGVAHFCVKVAGFDKGEATARLQKLGVRLEPSPEKGTLRFRDLHNLPVEVIAG